MNPPRCERGAREASGGERHREAKRSGRAPPLSRAPLRGTDLHHVRLSLSICDISDTSAPARCYYLGESREWLAHSNFLGWRFQGRALERTSVSCSLRKLSCLFARETTGRKGELIDRPPHNGHGARASLAGGAPLTRTGGRPRVSQGALPSCLPGCSNSKGRPFTARGKWAKERGDAASSLGLWSEAQRSTPINWKR